MHNFLIEVGILETEKDHFAAIETILANPAFIENYLSPDNQQVKNLVEILESLIIMKTPIDKQG